MDDTMVGKETKSHLLSREYNAPAFPALVTAHARRLLALRLAHLVRHAYTVRSGLCHLIDRKERWDLSIFQIGLRFIERCLNNDRLIRLSLSTY